MSLPEASLSQSNKIKPLNPNIHISQLIADATCSQSESCSGNDVSGNDASPDTYALHVETVDCVRLGLPGVDGKAGDVIAVPDGLTAERRVADRRLGEELAADVELVRNVRHHRKVKDVLTHKARRSCTPTTEFIREKPITQASNVTSKDSKVRSIFRNLSSKI